MAHSERVTGLSVSSTAKAEGEKPHFRLLTNSMARPENGEIQLADGQQARISAGLAFMLAHSLENEPESLEEALSAVEFVIPVLEITAGNETAFYVTGGRPLPAEKLDLRTLGIVMENNGSIVGMGAGAEVMGHPAQAIIEAYRHAASQGESLTEGSLVLAAGITPEVDVAARDNILGRYQDMGSISIRFV